MTYTDHSHNISGHYIGSHTHTFNPCTTGTITTLSTDSLVWQRTIEEMLLKDKYTTKQKEPEMTTLEKVRKERQEALERRQIEAMYADYDELDLDLVDNGTVYRFEWAKNDKTYTYAALKADGRWYVTGGSAPNGLPTEDFVAWLIGKKVASVALELLGAAS